MDNEFINLYLYKDGRDYKFAMAMGLAFTSLTLCSMNSMVSCWLKEGDMASILDVVPTMSVALWILTLISIGLNVTPIFFGS